MEEPKSEFIKCSKCEELKSIDDFHEDKTGPHGHRRDCKECRKKPSTRGKKKAPSGKFANLKEEIKRLQETINAFSRLCATMDDDSFEQPDYTNSIKSLCNRVAASSDSIMMEFNEAVNPPRSLFVVESSEIPRGIRSEATSRPGLINLLKSRIQTYFMKKDLYCAPEITYKDGVYTINLGSEIIMHNDEFTQLLNKLE
jgi:hypothetical protein